MTAEELAAKAGISAGYLSHLETGKRRYNQDTLEALAVALSCSPAELLSGPPPPPAEPEVEPWKHPHQTAGHYLKDWRSYRGLTLQELAERTGCTHANLSRLERGLIPYTQRTWEKIAAALGTDPASLILCAPGTSRVSQILEELDPSDQAHVLQIAETFLRRRDSALDRALATPREGSL